MRLLPWAALLLAAFAIAPPPDEPAPAGFTLEHRPPIGAAARWLDPLPRHFQAGYFEFRSTPSGELPTDADLLHVVTCGLSGSAMRGIPLVPEQDRRDVVAYVRHLAESA